MEEFNAVEFEPLELERGYLQPRFDCDVERQEDGSYGLYFGAKTPAVLRVEVGGLGERFFELDPKALEPIEVRFAERALVTVVLDGYEDVAGEFQYLSATFTQPLAQADRLRLGSYARMTFAIEAAGSTRPISAESGEHWFILSGNGRRHGHNWHGVAGAFRIDLTPGIQELRLPFRGLRTLEVELPVGVSAGNCKIELVDLPGEHGFAQIAGNADKAASTAAFMVPPGRYRILLSKLGEMEVAVEDDTRVAFAPSRRRE